MFCSFSDRLMRYNAGVASFSVRGEEFTGGSNNLPGN